jgi:hypothetical protein
VAVVLTVRRGRRGGPALSLALLLACTGAGCDRLAGDSATRLVATVLDAAARLKRSPSDTIVLNVVLREWPGGCPDGYRVEWRADTDRIPGLGVICTSGTRGYATIAYRGFVTVPRALQVIKQKGEPTTIALRKRHDGGIDVVALE